MSCSLNVSERESSETVRTTVGKVATLLKSHFGMGVLL